MVVFTLIASAKCGGNHPQAYKPQRKGQSADKAARFEHKVQAHAHAEQCAADDEAADAILPNGARSVLRFGVFLSGAAEPVDVHTAFACIERQAAYFVAEFVEVFACVQAVYVWF